MLDSTVIALSMESAKRQSLKDQGGHFLLICIRYGMYVASYSKVIKFK